MENLDQPASGYGFANEQSHADYHGFTKREKACIELGIPKSGDTELDELIRQSERKRIAAMAMQGLLANPDYMITEGNQKFIRPINGVIRVCVAHAETLLSELNKPTK